jgi:Tfp pilus assembly protein PilN
VIRINLLEETRTQAKAKGAGFALPQFQVAESVGVLILAGLVLAAITVIGVWAFWNAAELDSLADKIKEAEKEKARLEHVLRRNEILKQRQADLTRKIDVIAELKQNQAVPVQMLDQISRNLADHVWLTDLSFTPDKQLTITGFAQTQLAVSNFIGNLEDAPWFTEVQMGTVQQAKAADLTQYQIMAKFGLPAPKGAQAAPGGSSASKAPSPPAPARSKGGPR